MSLFYAERPRTGSEEMQVDATEFARQGNAFLDRLTTAQLAPPHWLVFGTAVLALLIVGYTPVWRRARNVVTIAHEGGHAVVALATGRRLRGITLHSDTSGVTVSYGKPYGPGMIATAVAGYPAPPLLGLGFAALLGGGRITLMLWASIALLAALLVKIRNIYGATTVLLTGAAVFAVSWFGSDTLQAGFAYLVAWFLLLAGTRPVFELQRSRSRRRGGDSDADELARLTRIPGLFWVLVFGAVAVAALVLGAGLLLAEAGISICVPQVSGGAGWSGTGCAG